MLVKKGVDTVAFYLPSPKDVYKNLKDKLKKQREKTKADKKKQPSKDNPGVTTA